jgi:photosystem II stability/assembly factor-like uncharacterized protein
MTDRSGTVVVVGTRRGLFVARSDRDRRHWTFTEPLLAGREVYHISIDPRDGSMLAATRHPVWGAHIHCSTDGARTWDVLPSSPTHADGRGVEAVWCAGAGPADRPERLFAGIEPAGLFVSDDRGASWRASSLNEHPTTTTWQPAGGALALHSIVLDPFDSSRMWCAVSAGGTYRSEDSGDTWQPVNTGVRADFLPRSRPIAGQCVHKLIVHPSRAGRLYQQNHCGVYRSDDHGTTWIEITNGLPSDFGYVLATDPANADVLYVVPEESSHMRTTAEGRLRVYRTTDAGASWTPLTRGLPQENAYISLLREAMTNDTGSPVGIYLGTSGGHLFASRDAGESWTLIAAYLPRILAVTATSGI